MNFATTCFMPKCCIKISDTVVSGIPRSASHSRTVSHQSLLIAAHTRSTFSGVPLVAGPPECGSLSIDSWPSLKHLCHTFICAALIAVPKSLLNHPNSFREVMFKLNAKFDANSLLYLLSHFECHGHSKQECCSEVRSGRTIFFSHPFAGRIWKT